MKFIRPFLMIVLIWIAGCSSDDGGINPIPVDNDCLEGTGAVESETRSVGDFTAVRSSIPANIFVTQGPLEDIRIEAPANFLPILRTTVANSTLNISLDECIESLGNVDIYVTIPVINSLSLSGVGSFSTLKDINTEQLSIEVTGIGDFNLQGTANTLNIDIEGTGEINAFDLITEICDIDITGVGFVEVTVNDELDVSISGGGQISYKGNPTITSSISGDGEIIDAN